MGSFRARPAAAGRGRRRLLIASVWHRNFWAIWTCSTVWMRSPCNSHARTTRLVRPLFKPRSLRQRIASTMPAATWRVPRRQARPREAIERQALAIDQACGVGLDAVLAARRGFATASGRLEDLVPLGALLADLERFAEADTVYRQAFFSYDDVSPFPLAWVCFQLGMLWGELVPAPDPALAAVWYRRAIAYLPGYVKARVHLAEIYASQDRTGDAEALLLPALSSRDPEVNWRLADVLTAQGRFEEAERQLDAARSRLRSASGETSARLRGPCRGVLRRQRQRLAGGRSSSRAPMSPIVPTAPCRQAGGCNRADCNDDGCGKRSRTKPAVRERPRDDQSQNPTQCTGVVAPGSHRFAVLWQSSLTRAGPPGVTNG